MHYADCDPVPAVASTPAPTETVVEAPAPAPGPAPIAHNVPFRVSTDAFFEFDKATLRPLGREALDELATRLASSTYDAIGIVGHADRIGAAKYNQRLSERRAAAMRDYLVAKGVDEQKISASGVGSNAPATTCPHLRGARLIACLQPDRFAEVTVAGTETHASAAAGN
jgi:OOP family OmpA-OmpF porin